ncbi:polysialyltransferase family glycosyltransferase [Marinobacter sp. tcs-11]|uniref:polysialyltransferase family glycosyltransferase n=1 Tax=Marinobacter sp. tcs-11 TaxID=1742860 RepID=UPI00257EF65F|nr:polysialyltransferase family glycosyltransferase [Marinobacter sp. tcs-11]
MKTINLVVGFTPYHALFSEGFINNLEGPVFCYFTKEYPGKPNSWRKISPFNNKILSMIFYSLRIWSWFLTGRKINLYIPHMCHFASNYPARSNRCHTVNIYEEGIANYYDAVSERWDISLSKKIMSWLVALPFKPYSGHITGIDVCSVASTLSSRPGKLVFKSKLGCLKKVNIPIEFGRPKRYCSEILFLDQPLNIESTEKREYLEHWLSQKKPNQKVYYKAHHDANASYAGMIQLSEELQSMPAERLLSLTSFGTVVSFHSSALINISKIFPDVKCVYLPLCTLSISVNGVEMDIFSFMEDHGVRRYL